METDDHDKNESASSLQKHRISDSSEQYEPDQDQIQQPPSQIKSYECTFCKRGFSNAQALGGHMNIHRKHKAKLKHSSSHEEPTHRQQQLYSPSTEDPDKSSNVVPHKEHDQDKTSVAPGDRQKELSSVDLELRLGPQPNKDTTRKFF